MDKPTYEPGAKRQVREQDQGKIRLPIYHEPRLLQIREPEQDWQEEPPPSSARDR